MTLLVTERPYDCTIRAWYGEDWCAPVPKWVVDDNETPWDVTDVLFELFILPTFNSPTRYALLTSAGDAGIIKESASGGLISFFYEQALAEANIPLSSAIGHRQFLRATFSDPMFGLVTKQLWRGPMLVQPARDTVTP